VRFEHYCATIQVFPASITRPQVCARLHGQIALAPQSDTDFDEARAVQRHIRDVPIAVDKLL